MRILLGMFRALVDGVAGVVVGAGGGAVYANVFHMSDPLGAPHVDAATPEPYARVGKYARWGRNQKSERHVRRVRIIRAYCAGEPRTPTCPQAVRR